MLRLATPPDLESVFRVYMHPEVVPFLGFDPMPLEEFSHIFQELQGGGTFYVWQIDGRVRGFCRASRHQGRAAHVAYLGTFAVHPDERGTGVARSLFEAVIDLLRSQDVLRVELMLEGDNHRALSFYTRLGFVQEGIMRAAYKRSDQSHYVNELVLAKLLAPLPTSEASMSLYPTALGVG